MTPSKLVEAACMLRTGCTDSQSVLLLVLFSSESLSKKPAKRRFLCGFPIPSPLVMTCRRQVMEYWESDIVPEIRMGKRVIVVAHANTIRALIKV